MKLSILIPTFFRSEQLLLGLYSLSLQKCKYDFEILVLNDGREDDTEKVCCGYQSQLNIKYVFTGQRNKDNIVRRCPGFAINIGVKMAIGDNIILSCPEIYVVSDCLNKMIETLDNNPKLLVHTKGFHEKKDLYSKQLVKTWNIFPLNDSNMTVLNTELPFFMAMNKNEFKSIGGYDEDFTGYCWDDNDIVNRLIRNGCSLSMINATIIHMYHKKFQADKNGWMYNKKLYESRKLIIKRNEGREWGLLFI